MGWTLLYLILEVLKWLIIARALMSWFVSPTSTNPIVEAVRRITDPILRPIRDLLPAMGGVDLSPIIAFFALYLVQGVILRLG